MATADWQQAFTEAEQNETHAGTWFPDQIGDSLVGVFLRYEVTPNNKVLALIKPEGDQPEVGVWMVNKVLRSRFEELLPAPGERIGIRYTGTRVSREGGFTYRTWLVVMPDRAPEGGVAAGVSPLGA